MKFDCTYCDVIVDDSNKEEYAYHKSHGHELYPKLEDTQEEKTPQGIRKNKTGKTSRKEKILVSKVKGFVDNEFYVESVVIDGKPKFLAKRLGSNDITIKEKIETEDSIVIPLKVIECGYFPYSFSSSEILELTNSEISKQEVLDGIKQQIDRYIVARDLDKHLILGNVLITYAQEWISTLHFPFFVGETESGKSSVLHLGKWLNYRCLYGEDLPNADIYNFLGSDEEGTGTIAEDEAQDLWNSREKIRTYKNSYSKGSLKARMLMLQNKKQQVFYKTFCPKWFAGEKIPQDKGFMERLAIVYMAEGEPKGNIKRVTDDDVKELNQIRNKLLVWKLQNIGKDHIKTDSGLKGRDQELWEDFLSTVKETSYYNKCQNVVTYYTKQRQEVIKNSIEAKLFKLVLDKLDENLQLNFVSFWGYLTIDNPEFPGRLDERGSKTFHPDDYANRITHNSLSKILEYKFQGERHQRKTRDEQGAQHQTTVYLFERDILEKLIRKYRIELPLDHPIFSGSRGSRGQQKFDGNNVDNVHDLNANSEGSNHN